MADVFISYAQGDREWVKQFATALEAEAFSVWWDPNLLPGSRFREIIKHELAEASAVIVVWSRLSVQSDWVLGEADEARSARKLVPVLSENVRPPTEFRGIHTADLSQWRGRREHPAFVNLVMALRALSGKAPAVGESPAGVTIEAPARPRKPPAPGHSANTVRYVLRGALALLAILAAVGLYFGADTLLGSDYWPPTFAEHVNAALATADKEIQNARDAQKIALAQEADTTAHAQDVSTQAKDAETRAKDAAVKAKARVDGFGVFNGTDYSGSWQYAGQVAVQGIAVAQGYGVKTYTDGYGDAYAGQWSNNVPNGYGVKTTSSSGLRTEALWTQFQPSQYLAIEITVWPYAFDSTLTVNMSCMARTDAAGDTYATCTAADGSTYAGELWSTMLPPDESIEHGVLTRPGKNGKTVYSGWWNYSGEDGDGMTEYPDGTKWKGARIHVSTALAHLDGYYGAKFDASGTITEQGRYASGHTLEKAYSP